MAVSTVFLEKSNVNNVYKLHCNFLWAGIQKQNYEFFFFFLHSRTKRVYKLFYEKYVYKLYHGQRCVSLRICTETLEINFQ